MIKKGLKYVQKNGRDKERSSEERCEKKRHLNERRKDWRGESR
jgi:hypothetical protein